MPLLQDATVDPVALGVTVALTGLAGVACGVLPAWHLSRTHGAQQNATHQRSAGRSSTLARNTLVVVEVALACVLLVGAGLLFRSFDALLQVDLGFQPQQAMAWRVDSPRAFNSLAEGNQYLDGVVPSVAALPGVEAVGLSDVLPLGRNRTWGVRAKGVDYPPGTGPSRSSRGSSISTTSRPCGCRSRPAATSTTATRAGSPKTVIINEHLARELWPDRDADRPADHAERRHDGHRRRRRRPARRRWKRPAATRCT